MLTAQPKPTRSRAGTPAEAQLVYRRDPANGALVEGHLTWGLFLHYTDHWPHIRPIHARAETIHEQKIFQEAFRKRRLIAPMSAFYQKDASGRRYAVSRAGNEPFGVAGIWENWQNPETRQWDRTFALITVRANSLIAPIHDRMLAIIDKQDFARWFDPNDNNPQFLLKPYAADDLVIAPVGKYLRLVR